MARRNWSNAYKHQLMRAYVRILRKQGTGLTAHGVDNIVNRSHFLHLAQEEVCTDPELRRDIDVAFATMFLRNHKQIIEAVRPTVDLQLRQEAMQANEDMPAPPEGVVVVAKPEVSVDKPLGVTPVQQPVPNLSDLILTLATQLSGVSDVAMRLRDFLNASDMPSQPSVETFERQVEVEKVVEVERVVEKIVEVIKEVPAQRSFSGRKPGELRVMFGEWPSIIVVGFSPVIINTTIKKLVNIAANVRNQSTLMQCVAEHPDASVLVATSEVKLGPRLAYLLDALQIQVIQIPNTKDDLEKVVAHLNGYVHVKSEPTSVFEHIELPQTDEKSDEWPLPSDSRRVAEAMEATSYVKQPKVENAKYSESASIDDADQDENAGQEDAGQAEIEEEVEETPRAIIDPSNRPAVFITHGHSAFDQKSMRLRFIETMDIRYCAAADLNDYLLGHKNPIVVHFASIAPSQCVDTLNKNCGTLIYTRSTYLDVLGKLSELEREIQSLIISGGQ